MKLLTHLGLGDHFITYGLVRELDFKYDIIELFCKEENYNSLSEMYENTNIFPIKIKSDIEAMQIMNNDPFNSLKIGYNNDSEIEQQFGESFYYQMNLPYEIRWKYPMRISKKNNTEQRIFIHDNINFKIPLEGFRPYKTESIFDYASIIENAQEIHVIESSFRQMIEFLNPKGLLYLHYFKNKSFRIVPSKHNWIIINEDKNENRKNN